MFQGLPMGHSRFSMERLRHRCHRPVNGALRIRTRTFEGIITVKRRELKFRHPQTVEHMQSLPEEEAEKHPTVVRGHDWAATHYWRSGARRRNGVFSEGSTKRDHCRSKKVLCVCNPRPPQFLWEKVTLKSPVGRSTIQLRRLAGKSCIN